MNPAVLRARRRQRGWTQADLARRLGVTQAYVCLLERGRRTMPQRLAGKLVKLLNLPPSDVPVSGNRIPMSFEQATHALAALGYPGFAYLGGRRPVNPAELMVRILRSRNIDARVAEALPWLLLRYPNLDWPWLVREVKVHDVQNRLGFVLAVAQDLAALCGEQDTADMLAMRQHALEPSRLQREDSFRASMTDAERRWLRGNRPPQAAQWNMLSTMMARDLCRACG